MAQLFYGFLLAIAIAFAAYRAHSLTRSGAMTATLIGTIIFGLGGWQWAVLLLIFFVSSSLLSRLFSNRKSKLNEKYEKGSQRDAGQVLANGGIAALFAGLHFFIPSALWPWLAFSASLAAVNADTWATELGVLDPKLPRLITTGQPVEKGTSGGISLGGNLAALAGAGLVAACAQIVRPVQGYLVIFSLTTLAGFLGALFDSYLGATVQAIYTCPTCKKETERHPIHTFNTATTLLRGFKWLNNDLVNLGCALTGALLGFAILWMVA